MEEIREFIFSPLMDDQGGRENDRYETFNTEDKKKVPTFVREYCQNLSDAKIQDSTEPVRASIRVLEDGEFDLNFLRQITKSLEGPCNKKINDLAPRILILEEENTTGLRGSLNIRDKDSDHTAFWHTSGYSPGKGKQANKNKSGSAGKGNIMYFSASEVKTTFAITKRIDADSHEEYLMGKCELERTFLNPDNTNEEWDYAGFYSNRDERKIIPIDEKNEIKKFKSAFNLRRGNGFGTSFVIPFIQEEFTEENILKAILEEYFVSFIEGKMEIDIMGEKINKNSILDLVDKYLEDEDKEDRDFIFDCFTTDESKAKEIKANWLGGNSKEISEDIFFGADELKKLKTDFDAGKIISLKIPVTLEKVSGANEKDFFYFYITKNVEKEKKLFYRDTIPLSSEPLGNYQKKYSTPYKSLIRIESGNFAQYCKLAESPNHTRFDSEKPKFKEIYKNNIFKDLRPLSIRLAKFFFAHEEGLDLSILDEVVKVSIVIPENPSKRKKKKRKPGVHTDGPPVPPRRRHKWFKQDTGFGWRMENWDDPLPSYPIKVECVFALAEEGSPHNQSPKGYDPSDFDLGDDKQNWDISEDGMEIIEKKYNKLILNITNEKFFIEVKNKIFEEWDVISSPRLIS